MPISEDFLLIFYKFKTHLFYKQLKVKEMKIREELFYQIIRLLLFIMYLCFTIIVAIGIYNLIEFVSSIKVIYIK